MDQKPIEAARAELGRARPRPRPIAGAAHVLMSEFCEGGKKNEDLRADARRILGALRAYTGAGPDGPGAHAETMGPIELKLTIGSILEKY